MSRMPNSRIALWPNDTPAAAVQRGGKRVVRGVPSTPKGRPSVTVVVPAYNYARFLPDCARSVLAQRDVDVELLIFDDCSTDSTPEVCAMLARSDDRVSIIRHEHNRGHIPTINEGFEAATGDYVVKLDADDLIAPGALARATALFELHPEVGFVYGRPRHFSGSVPNASDSPPRSWTIWRGRDWIAARCRDASNVISQPEVVMRTSAVHAIGPVPVELAHTSDLHTWLRLASGGEVGRVNGPVQGYYRVHEASMQNTIHSGVLFDLRARRDAFDAALAPEVRDPAVPELHDTARRALAAAALGRACRAYDRGRVGVEQVDAFVAFALETWPAARDLPAWMALDRRKAFGAARVSRHPRFLTAAAARRASEELARWRWLRTGEW
jgi:hypothetical protein